MIKVAINGFGRIGRRVCRLIQERNNIQVVAASRRLSNQKLSKIHGL